jgi:putative two-component system response regulator
VSIATLPLPTPVVPTASLLRGDATFRKAKVLVIDDQPAMIELLSRLLTRQGYTVSSAADGHAGLEAVSSEGPDVILLDVSMPGLSGLEVCRRLKSDTGTRFTPVVLVTGHHDPQLLTEAADAGADDVLAKPVAVDELLARVRALVRLKRDTDNLESAEIVMTTLAVTIEARDPYTKGHCERLAAYGAAVGERLGLSGDDLHALRRGGFLHDLGKIAVPDAVLLKAGPLMPDEYAVMKRHTVVGDELCAGMTSLRKARAIIRHHHECLDGSGYPDGLSGDAVPLLAQIIGMVDVFDALTTDRPYRPALSVDTACAHLREDVRRGRRRADLLDCFLKVLSGATGDASRHVTHSLPTSVLRF